jgi:hypothetical protein
MRCRAVDITGPWRGTRGQLGLRCNTVRFLILIKYARDKEPYRGLQLVCGGASMESGEKAVDLRIRRSLKLEFRAQGYRLKCVFAPTGG